MASWGEARPDTAAETMLGPAWSLRWQAPELALFLAERARAVIELVGDGPARLRAEATAVVASCRLGQRLDVVDRAIDAIRVAERHGDAVTGAMLRVELAGCARTAGVPLVGAAVLRPVLTTPDVQPAMRADALVQLAGCLTRTVDPAVLDDALAEADRLYDEDRQLDADSRVVQRALLRSVASGEQRRRGDARAAVDAAQEGIDLLGGLSRATADNGQAGAQVALRLVHGLLDLGRVDEATVVAAAELRRPVRAPAAGAIGWLAVAMAVRAHLANGAANPALALLREAAELGKRHRLSSLRAEALTILSDAHERVGQLAEALDCLRTAQGVRLGRARVVYSARTRLVSAFGETTSPEEFVRMLGIPAGRRSVAGRGQGASPVSRIGSRAAARRTPVGDVTMVLVDLTTPRSDNAGAIIGEHVLSHVLDRLRDAAPSDAQVARVGGAELAVLLPGAPVDQAERWVADLRGAMASVDWSSFTPGLTVAVRATVAEPAGRRVAASPPRPTTGTFEVPTVPFPLQHGTTRPSRSRSRSGTESPASQALLAKALEQWRQTKSPERPADTPAQPAAEHANGPTHASPAEPEPTPPSATQQAGPDQPAQPTAADHPSGVALPATPSADWMSRFEAAKAAFTGEPTRSGPSEPEATTASHEPAWTPTSDPSTGSTPVGPAWSSRMPDPESPPEPSGDEQPGSAAGSAQPADWHSQAVTHEPSPTPDWSSQTGSGGAAGSGSSADWSAAPASSGSDWSSTDAAVPRGPDRPSAGMAAPGGSEWSSAGAAAPGGSGWSSTDPAASRGPEWSSTDAASASSRWPSQFAATEGSRAVAAEGEPGALAGAAEPRAAAGGPSGIDPAGQAVGSGDSRGGPGEGERSVASTPPGGSEWPSSGGPDWLATTPGTDWATRFEAARAALGGESTEPPPAPSPAAGENTAFPTDPLPALPIPPPLEPATPAGIGGFSPSAEREPSAEAGDSGRFSMAAQQETDTARGPLSADPSIRISAADIAAADTPEMGLWAPRLPPPEPPMGWPTDDQPSMADPDQTGPRHAVEGGDGRSVLSSLGITAGGSGGGRRRAKDEPEPEPEHRARTVSFDDVGYLEPLAPPEHWDDRPEPATPPSGWESAASWGNANDDAASFSVQWQPHDLPAQHTPIADPAPLPVPPPTRPAEVALAAEGDDERTEPIREPEPEPEPPRVRTGRRRRSVQLADLLTEALMAYQTAQDANDARSNPLSQDPSSGLPGPTSLPEPLAGSAGRDLGRDVAGGGGTRIGDSRWLTTRWDPTSDRP